MSTNNGRQFPKGKPVIQISGFSKAEKHSLTDKIKGLGATYYPQVEFHKDCDVLVLKKLCRSEKFICALATGTAIVSRKYVEDSVKLGKWQNVYRYIFKPKDELVVEDQMYAASFKSFMKARGQKKAFSDWTCAVQVSTEGSQAVYERILRVGGAKVVDLHLQSLTSASNLPHKLTHFFTDRCFICRGLHILSGSGVHCVTADYMGDYVIRGEEPQAHHYVVPYCPMVDLTISPLKPADGIVNLSDTYSDSDVEFVSSSSPHNIRQTPQLVKLPGEVQLISVVNPTLSETRTLNSAQPTSSSKGNMNNNNCEAKDAVKTDSHTSTVSIPAATSDAVTPAVSLTDVFHTHQVSNSNCGAELNEHRQDTTQSKQTTADTPCSSSQERLTKPPGQSAKKYPKMLVITPVKRPSDSNSQGSQSSIDKTPVKVSKLCNSPTQLATPPRLLSSPIISPTPPKTPKTPVMQANALHKYFTVSPRVNTSVPPVTKSAELDKSSFDNLNTRPSLDVSMEHQISAVTSTADLAAPLPTSRAVEEHSCLGLLDHLTSRLTMGEREEMYNTSQHFLTEQSKLVEEEINLTNEYPHRELQEIPVLLCKQIRTYFEDECTESHLNGLEMVSQCMSSLNYPPAYLLKQIYHILLTTVDRRVAYAAHECLVGRLQVNAPNMRLCEDVGKAASKLCKTRRMSMVYMASLIDKNHCGRRIYLKSLNTAAETIRKGGLSSDSKPETDSTTETDPDGDDNFLSAGDDEELSSLGGDNSQEQTADDEKDECLGSTLFLDYLCDLLQEDFRTARSPKQSMLYEMCKGNFFVVNLVDSEDTRALLDLSKLLMEKEESELMYKVLEVVGLIGELCALDCMKGADHSLNVVVSHLSTIVSGCTTADADGVLMSYLPTWLSIKVIKHLLEDKSMYSSDLISASVASFPHPSLQLLLSKYFFLVPCKSAISSACNAVSTSQTLSNRKKKRNCKGETPLHTACIKGDLEKVRQLLLEPDTSVNATDHAGWTPLHEACNHGHKHIVELLLNHKSPHFHFDGGGKVDLLMAAGEDDVTPLQDAVRVDQIEVVKLLLKYGGRQLAEAEAKLGVAITMATTDEMEQILRNALKPSAVEDPDQSSNDLSISTQLRIATPSNDIYSSHVCSTDEEVVERYVMYCLQMLSLHVASQPLTPTDKDILNRLSSHLEPFVKHVMWLRASVDGDPPAYLRDGLRALLLLSL